jgi:hypothetical protein
MASKEFSLEGQTEMCIEGNEIMDITVLQRFGICINENTNEIIVLM